jgi:hypothetical protein
MFSVITSVCTEGCKKLLDEANVTYASNILVFIIACIVGAGGTCIYYILNGIEFGVVNIVCAILMGLATSLGAMVGYDKIIQTIAQLK